jgi:hypothetical protein
VSSAIRKALGGLRWMKKTYTINTMSD